MDQVFWLSSSREFLKVKILIVGSVNGAFKKLFALVDSIQKKKGKFDLLLCAGNFFPASNDAEKLEEFYEVALSKSAEIPIPTYFVDSTEIIGPFMQKKGMHKFHPNLHFLGRNGIHTFKDLNNLRIAFVSGKDAEILGTSVSESIKPSNEYFGAYYGHHDIENLILENKNKDVDIFLTSQLPFTLFGSEGSHQHSSSLLDVLIDNINPRYVYSACELEAHVKVQPFLNR